MAGKRGGLTTRGRKPLHTRPVLIDSAIQTDVACEAVALVRDTYPAFACTSSGEQPVEAVSIHELTKEQLIGRLRALQAFVRRQQQLLATSETLRKKDRHCLEQISHNVKVLVVEQRQAYILLHDLMRSSAVAFANSQDELNQNVAKVKEALEDDKRSMRNTIARNDVVVEKARVAVVNVKTEIDRVLEINETLKQRAEATARDRAFVECQYHELRNKQNKEYLANEFLCPKCKAWKACLNEVTDSIAPLKEENKKQAKLLEKSQREIQAKDKQLAEIRLQQKRICSERDTYKDHNAKLMERQKHFRKLLADKASPMGESLGTPNSIAGSHSPAMNGNHLTASPMAVRSATTQNVSPIKDSGFGSSETSSPDVISGSGQPAPIQSKRHSDREEGEVRTPEEPPISPIPPAPEPPAPPLSKTALKKKRKAEMMAMAEGRAPAKKVYDYVYVMNERPPPLSSGSTPDSRLPQHPHMSPPGGWRKPAPHVDPYDFPIPAAPSRYDPRPRPSFHSPTRPHRMSTPAYPADYPHPEAHSSYPEYYRQPRYRSAAEYPPQHQPGPPAGLPWHANGANRGRPPPGRHPNDEDWTAWR
uniref:SH3 domain-containing protein n=1 Tax=Panagrellus redivivus TaxID=6233 RepID=A0A7E4UL35_PANRE